MKSYIITDSSQLEETPMRLYRIGGHGSRIMSGSQKIAVQFTYCKISPSVAYLYLVK